MRIRYIGLLIVSIVVSFTFGFTIRQMIHSNNVVYDYEAFYKYIEKINRKFEVTGYTQILKDTDSVVAVPDSLFGRQDFDKGLYSRQKSFFFKNKDNGVVILLSVSACKTELTPSWTSSIGYTTSLYNQPEGRFKDTYSNKFSDNEVYVFSFVRDNVNVQLISIAKESGDKILALDEMVKFLNQMQKQL